MADIEQEFEKAAKDISNLEKRPTDQELLTIYALYKQATVGDCNQPKPSMFQLKEKAKHESWSSKKGMSSEQAKQEYVDLCKKLIANYGLKE